MSERMSIEVAVATEIRDQNFPVDRELARLLRRRAGITQQALAALVGVTRPCISRWESGTRQPRGEVLSRYRSALERLASLHTDRVHVNDGGPVGRPGLVRKPAGLGRHGSG
jgi:transcriptional regulator with XRE-family HTH domain